MKRLNNYIQEKLVIDNTTKAAKISKVMMNVYDYFDYVGEKMPTKLAARILQVGLCAPDPNDPDHSVYAGGWKYQERPKVKLEYDKNNKTLTISNLKGIRGTQSKLEAFFDTFYDNGHKIIFADDIQQLEIRSGCSLEDRWKWPNINQWWPYILRCIDKYNKNLKIGCVEINRFVCDCDFPANIFDDVDLYIEKLYFSECKWETSMNLPNKEERKNWKNPNMKWSSTSIKATEYYKENGF